MRVILVERYRDLQPGTRLEVAPREGVDLVQRGVAVLDPSALEHRDPRPAA